MSAQDLPIERVQALRLEAGDTLVLKCTKRLTREHFERMRAAITSMIPAGVHVLITDPDVDLVASRLAEDPEIAMIDAAMVEMGNIHPPLKRSECKRLIRAALNATPPAPQPLTDWESRAELAEQEVVKLSEERDHFKALYMATRAPQPAQEAFAYYNPNVKTQIMEAAERDRYAGRTDGNGMVAYAKACTAPLYTTPQAPQPLTNPEPLHELARVCFDAGIKHGQGAKNGWFTDGKALAIIDRITKGPAA